MSRARVAAVAAGALIVGMLAAPTASAAEAEVAGGASGSDLTSLVNPFIGTQGDGNTFPGASAPFGMAQLSPDTGHYAGYRYTDERIRGFSMVHVSGVGCGLGGDLPVLPTTGDPTSTDYGSYALGFDHVGEVASPGYYAVDLEAPAGQVRAELSATSHTGWQRYTFPATDQASVLINTGQALHSVTDSQVQVVDDHTVRTSVTGQGFCQSTEPYTLHFLTTFDRPFAASGTWSGDELTPGSTASEGPGRRGAWLTFDTTTDREVGAVTALSYVDEAGAAANLAAEGGGTFDQTVDAARGQWADRLGQVQADGGSTEQRRTFYSSLYRALMTPSTGTDVDGRYLGWDDAVHEAGDATYYQNFSLWDTYRTQVQLLGLLAPAEARDQAISLLRAEQQGGWLPRWGYGPVETNIMTGDPVTPFLTTAWQYGLLDGYEDELYEALRRNADEVPPADNPANGRVGNPTYIEHGYVPYTEGASGKPGDFDLAHGGSATMEYAVADCSVSVLASALGHDGDAARFAERSRNWRSLIDPATGFPRARGADGVFAGDPDPAKSSGFHEGTAWQYQWLVPQDMPGLIRSMGGADVANERLDHFFAYDELLTDPSRVAREVWVNSAYDYYGQDRYNPQNEPDLHAPYAYLWTGQPWKTADVVRAATTLFTDGPTGMTGNDDLGTMSAWHVLSAIGLYPAVAGTDTLAIGSPLFDRVEIDLPEPWFTGDLVVTAAGTSTQNRYVQSATLNGDAHRATWLSVDDLRAGATLDLELGSAPSDWGTAKKDAPPSPCPSSGQGTSDDVALGLSTPMRSVIAGTEAVQVPVTASVVASGRGVVTGAVTVAAQAPLTVTPPTADLKLKSKGMPATADLDLAVTVPAGTPPGAYDITAVVRTTVGEVTRVLTLTVVDAGLVEFTPGTADEDLWLVDAGQSQLGGGVYDGRARFADNDRAFVYRFALQDDAVGGTLSLDLGNEFLVQVSDDGQTWRTVLEETAEVRDLSNRDEAQWRELDLTDLSDGGPSLYVRIADSFPQDGWGGWLARLKLEQVTEGSI